MTAEGHQADPQSNSRADAAAMGYRPAVVPIAVYFGAALKNAGTVLTELAPWAYLGIAVLLLFAAQAMQRRQGRAWPWAVALTAGFGIALIAWLGSMAVVNIATAEIRQ